MTTQDFSVLAAVARHEDRWSLTVAALAGALLGLLYGAAGFLGAAAHFPEAAAGLVSSVALGSCLAAGVAAIRNVATRAR